MPELPEMQALAERLNESIAGRSLKSIVPFQFSALKTFDPQPESLVGRTVTDVGRRGKYLVVSFDADRVLIHLSQGGRLVIEEPPKTTHPKFAVVRFVFDGGLAAFIKEFGTQRKAGWWVLASGDDGPLERLGPEPDSDEFAATVMSSEDGRRLHTILRDQRTVAGMGRGYTDDILHRAKLSPYASLKSLDENARMRLLRAIEEILEQALTAERRRTGGLPDKLSGRFVVHGRAGEPCPVCGGTLRRVSFEDYEIVYCPPCQTDGKVLADRRLSRLLR